MNFLERETTALADKLEGFKIQSAAEGTDDYNFNTDFEMGTKESS